MWKDAASLLITFGKNMFSYEILLPFVPGPLPDRRLQRKRNSWHHQHLGKKHAGVYQDISLR